MKTGIITKLALVALFWIFVGGCKKQNKAGEAFVVLKSGEVVYMADMEVVCLKPSFKIDFNRWKLQYENESKSLDQEIANTIAKRIKELDAKVDKISREQKEITTETIQIISAYIENFIKFEDIKDREKNLFKVIEVLGFGENRPDWGVWVESESKDIRVERCCLIEKVLVEKLTYENQYRWRFYLYVPREIEYSPVETAIKTAAQKWESLKSGKNELMDIADSITNDGERKIHELKEKYRREFCELTRKDALVAVRTGSKGDFVMPGEAAYLYAETQRDNGEKLAWLVRADPSSTKIKMSVSNAASVGGGEKFDDYWMFHILLND